MLLGDVGRLFAMALVRIVPTVILNVQFFIST